MSLIETLKSDFKVAMKSGDAFKLGVLRMVVAALQNRAIEKRGAGGGDAPLTDDEVRAVLTKETKRRKDAVLVYREGNRIDLAEQEEREAAFIERYLPAQMSEEEVTAQVQKIIEELRSTQHDLSFGAIMKEAMKGLQGKADGKLVGEIIRRLTA